MSPFYGAGVPSGTHRHPAAPGRGSACCAGCRAAGRRPGEGSRAVRACRVPATRVPSPHGHAESPQLPMEQRHTSMHRQGTRNWYGSETRWPPGTRTCGYGSGTSWPGARGPPGSVPPPAVTCWWKGRGSSSHSRASWWHSRTIRAGPSGTATSMVRASGTQAWVKAGPGGAQIRGRGGQPVPAPLWDPQLLSSLTGGLDGDQVAAADGQALVGDGAQGHQDLPPALHRETVELHLPLRGAGSRGGERAPPVPIPIPVPHGAPRTHRRAARCPVPPPHLQPAGPVGAQLQEVELQPAEPCGDTGVGRMTRVGTHTQPPRPRYSPPGAPPAPYLRHGGPGAPAGRAGRAARAGTASPCSAPGPAASAGTEPGLPGGSGGGSACCRLPGRGGRKRGRPCTRHPTHRGAPCTGERGGIPPTPPAPAPFPPSPPREPAAPCSQPAPGPVHRGEAPLGGDTHRWPGTPASERTAISAPRPRCFPLPFSLPPPGAPVLTKLAETRRRGTAAPAGGTGGTDSSGSSSSSRAAAPGSGSPMAERCSRRCRCSVPGARCPPRAGPAAFLRRHVRPRPVRAAATCSRQRFLRRPPRGADTRGKAVSWRRQGGALFPYRDTAGGKGLPRPRGMCQHRGPRALAVSPRSRLRSQTVVPGGGRGAPTRGATPQHPRVGRDGHGAPPQNAPVFGCGRPLVPAHFFFFSCVLVNQESSSFLL